MFLSGQQEIYLRFGLALSAVLVLIVICAWGLKYMKARNLLGGGRAPDADLRIQDSLRLDDKRRLLVIQRKNMEYLILLGCSGESLLGVNQIESSMPSGADSHMNSRKVTRLSPMEHTP